jgi:hypothetical protein
MDKMVIVVGGGLDIRAALVLAYNDGYYTQGIWVTDQGEALGYIPHSAKYIELHRVERGPWA